MSTDLIVAKVDQARLLLAEAKNAPEAKRVADMAHAAEVYARRQKLSDEAILYAREICVDAKALLGEFLKSGPKNQGAKGSVVTGRHRQPVKDNTPTLADIGITKDESAEAQFIAQVKNEAPKEFEAYKQGKKSLAALRRSRKPKEHRALKAATQPGADRINEPADVVNELVFKLWTYIDAVVQQWPADIDIAVLVDGLRNYADGLEQRHSKKKRKVSNG